MCRFSLLLAELMIGTTWPSGRAARFSVFQSPISGVNDWNTGVKNEYNRNTESFSLLLAELMIGTHILTSLLVRATKVSVSY